MTRSELPADIAWVCTACRDDGVIHGWERSPFDLRPDPHQRHHRPDDSGDVRVFIEVGAEVAATLRTLTLIDTATERLVFSATVAHGHVMLHGTVDEFEELGDYVAAEANHTTDRRRRKRLDTAFDTLRRT